MPASFLDLVRTLSSFSPARVPLADAPWDTFVEWAIANGLAPMAAYNLEYRLGRVGAPQFARDRFLSIYTGTINDNVMKLVGFKASVSGLEGRKLTMVGAASFAEALYPNVAFRPVIDLDVFLPRRDLDPFAAFLRRAEYQPEAQQPKEGELVLSDGRTTLTLVSSLTGDPAEDEGLMRRALPMKVYGPSIFRLELEDALLVHVLRLARAGFERPFIELVDLRELIQGAPGTGGAYSRPVDPQALLQRAAVWKVERPLWAALTLIARLFPETEGHVKAALPALSFPVRELLERLLVNPLADLGRGTRFSGEEAVRQVLAGA